MKYQEDNFDLAREIGKGALLTATNENGEINTMTVSWGGVGIFWGKEVALVLVRPSRHTFSFMENGTLCTLSFLGEEKKDVLSLCGRYSGRDVDKLSLCGLTYKTVDGACVFDCAKKTLVLKKLYSDTIKPECFIDTPPEVFYKNGDFHTLYVCEIINIA